MPQLKIGHLRALPDVSDPTARARLHALGANLARANDGIGDADRIRLDDLVAVVFSLSAEERDTIRRWADSNPLPISRRIRLDPHVRQHGSSSGLK
jgi:hypothetical protein